MPRLFTSLLLSLLIASPASAVTMAWMPVGNPGNACEVYTDPFGGTTCYGSVDYSYYIGRSRVPRCS